MSKYPSSSPLGRQLFQKHSYQLSLRLRFDLPSIENTRPARRACKRPRKQSGNQRVCALRRRQTPAGLLEIEGPHPATGRGDSRLTWPAHCDLRIVRYVFHRAFLLRSLYIAISRGRKARAFANIFAFIFEGPWKAFHAKLFDLLRCPIFGMHLTLPVAMSAWRGCSERADRDSPTAVN